MKVFFVPKQEFFPGHKLDAERPTSILTLGTILTRDELELGNQKNEVMPDLIAAKAAPTPAAILMFLWFSLVPELWLGNFALEAPASRRNSGSWSFLKRFPSRSLGTRGELETGNQKNEVMPDLIAAKAAPTPAAILMFFWFSLVPKLWLGNKK